MHHVEKKRYFTYCFFLPFKRSLIRSCMDDDKNVAAFYIPPPPFKKAYQVFRRHQVRGVGVGRVPSLLLQPPCLYACTSRDQWQEGRLHLEGCVSWRKLGFGSHTKNAENQRSGALAAPRRGGTTSPEGSPVAKDKAPQTTLNAASQPHRDFKKHPVDSRLIRAPSQARALGSTWWARICGALSTSFRIKRHVMFAVLFVRGGECSFPYVASPRRGAAGGFLRPLSL
ncbi:UNVERIFIED_CONTAM: hypothetical protein K2H54_020867 [Gekko kuhli]